MFFHLFFAVKLLCKRSRRNFKRGVEKGFSNFSVSFLCEIGYPIYIVSGLALNTSRLVQLMKM